MPGSRPGNDKLGLSAPLPLPRLPGNVAAAESIRPFDAVDRLVGTALRLPHRFAHRANIEHAAAIGENGAVCGHRAGVEDFDTFDSGGVIEPLDARAFCVVAGEALG